MEEKEPQTSTSLTPHPLLVGGATFVLADLIGLLAHFGPAGWLAGGIAGYVAYRHGRDFIVWGEHVITTEVKSHEGLIKQPEDIPMLSAPRRTFWQKAWGIYPEAEQPIQPPEVLKDTMILETPAPSQEREKPAVIYAGATPRLQLSLASSFRPDVNVVLREGIFCCGVKNSGKTGILARIIEQISRFPIPMIVFDKEGDLESLVSVMTNGRIADRTHWYSVEDIYTHHLQVVVNLQDWLRDEQRAIVMTSLVNQLIDYTTALAPDERIPCPVFLDEAQYWLPETSVSYLTSATQRELIDSFGILLSTGRKRGLTPFFFTQRIAQIDKSMVSLGIQIFLRQVLDNDVRRCMEYIRQDVIEDRRNLANLAPGQGVVCLPGGAQLIVQFDERESRHVSHTPTVERVMRKPLREQIGLSLIKPPLSLRSQESLISENGETVKRPEKPGESGESFTTPGESEETLSPTDKEAILRALTALVQSGKPVTREAIKAHLGWNNRKHHLVKIFCDEYGIAPRLERENVHGSTATLV